MSGVVRGDSASDSPAAAFGARGTGRGDRAGVHLQNVPQYALALWKLGAPALGLNPMYRRRELRRIIVDSGAVGVVCADGEVHETLGAPAGSTVRWLISTSALDYRSRNDPRVFRTTERHAPAPDGDLVALIVEFEGRSPSPMELTRDDVTFLTYSSGTTGLKGGVPSHLHHQPGAAPGRPALFRRGADRAPKEPSTLGPGLGELTVSGDWVDIVSTWLMFPRRSAAPS
ncbi:AMP-binding protein [Streptomyces sp. SH5]|uniref:AMP-binding protein n=1 Tax=Streptomyces sp. SH5 TaxID=3041765 RepID=UPI0024782A9B|nr:AMP-binding protein [Streptomyces sp. SH5]WGP14078.1 AMP-binding protein [Streptomyces sp. SH5]